jgi:carbon monoxide dehydrogenase subunit G
MKLHNECVIAAALSPTWSAIVDLARIAAALPGATLEKADSSGTFRGGMKIKFGPVVAEYAGTATLEEVDADDHTMVVRVQGKEARGQGSASAAIHIALSPATSGTHLSIDTELSVTGIAAQLGNGMIEDVSSMLLGEFATRLERDLSGAPSTSADSGTALDVGALAGNALRRRLAPLVAYGIALAITAVGAYQLGRRR